MQAPSWSRSIPTVSCHGRSHQNLIIIVCYIHTYVVCFSSFRTKIQERHEVKVSADQIILSYVQGTEHRRRRCPPRRPLFPVLTLLLLLRTQWIEILGDTTVFSNTDMYIRDMTWLVAPGVRVLFEAPTVTFSRSDEVHMHACSYHHTHIAYLLSLRQKKNRYFVT